MPQYHPTLRNRISSDFHSSFRGSLFSLVSNAPRSLFPPLPLVKQCGSPRVLFFFFRMLTDLDYMQLAVEEARASADAGEVPIGAILVHDDKILARSGNRTIRDNDP